MEILGTKNFNWCKRFVITLTIFLCSCVDETNNTNVNENTGVGSQGKLNKGAGADNSNSKPSSLLFPDSLEITNKLAVTNGVVKSAYFIDDDPVDGRASGELVVELKDEISFLVAMHQKHHVYLIDEFGVRQGEPVFSGFMTQRGSFELSNIDLLNLQHFGFELVAVNLQQELENSLLVRAHDKAVDRLVVGYGGNYDSYWVYGEGRNKLEVIESNGLCYFDNGLVSIVNMNGEKDDDWHNLPSPRPANTVDNDKFPSYSFDCSETNEHNADAMEDEYGIWTYSAINDAMHYGNVIYKTLTHALKEPPLKDKLRFRVHYDHQGALFAYWDGAYVSLSDAIPFYYSFAQLDVMAHEIAHGVLIRISNLGEFGSDFSKDILTLHEAFADITGVYVKHSIDAPNVWFHTESPYDFFDRNLDSVRTEYSAVPSYLDYDDTGNNYYLGIGLLTYPFYLLSQEYGIDQTYQLWLNAARNCWQSEHLLPDIAMCLHDLSEQHGIAKAHVVSAFQSVKIALDTDMLLSHFKIETQELTVNFTDNSQTTEQLTYSWSFGDGAHSDVANPQHQYAEAGEYQVSLTVTDVAGNTDVFSRHVIVKQE